MLSTTHLRAPQLELVKEAKIADLIGESGGHRLEASGVVAIDGLFYVIFDNVPHIGVIGEALSRNPADNLIITKRRGPTGYEDIAYDRQERRFYVLIEAMPYRAGTFMARVRAYDEDLRHVSSRWLDFPLDRPNKGLEGLTCLRRDGQAYLLGLCEGNRCKGGAAGRRPGGGRIQLFATGRRRWQHAGTIQLPERVWFEDYSSLAVAGDRVAVVSQASSALWVGRLEPSSWRLADDGATYLFPRDDRGRVVYGTVEGVSWTSPDTVVVVSDRAKPTQPTSYRAKDRSIHVFAIPRAVG